MIISVCHLATILNLVVAIGGSSDGNNGSGSNFRGSSIVNQQQRHRQLAPPSDRCRIVGDTCNSNNKLCCDPLSCVDGACVVTAAPPTTPSPTKAPVTSQPTIDGAGYCSNSGTPCSTDIDCGCDAAAAALKEAPWGNVRRHLADCTAIGRKNTCRNTSGCAWENNSCIQLTADPTSSPTTNQVCVCVC